MIADIITQLITIIDLQNTIINDALILLLQHIDVNEESIMLLSERADDASKLRDSVNSTFGQL